MILIVFHVVFFGVLGHVLFAGMDGKKCVLMSLNSTLRYNDWCSSYDTEGCRDYFGSLWGGMLQLQILLTTANFPDVMMPVYNCNVIYSLYFVFFITIGIYFLLSLVLAVAYTHFQTLTKDKVIMMIRRRMDAMNVAFNLLCNVKNKSDQKDTEEGTGSLAKVSSPKETSWEKNLGESEGEGSAEQKESEKRPATLSVSHSGTIKISCPSDGTTNIDTITQWHWNGLMKALRPNLDKELVEVLFHMVDANGSGTITRNEFHNLGPLMSIHAERKAGKPLWIGRLPRCAHTALEILVNDYLQSFVEHAFFKGFFDLLILCSGIIMLCTLSVQNNIEYSYSLRKSEFDVPELKATNGLLERIVTGIVLLFAMEIILKVMVYGWRYYWRKSFFNKLDFVIVSFSLVERFGEIFTGTTDGTITAIMSLIRLVRLVRFLKLFPEFHSVIQTFVQIFPALMRYAAVVFLVFYSFAIIGMELFSGVLYPQICFVNGKDVSTFQWRSTPLIDNKTGVDVCMNATRNALMNSSYAKMNYWKNNFDRIDFAFVTLFEQMVVNNWPIVMEGCVHATSKFALIYFTCFYFFTVIIVLNVLTAFLIESYQIQTSQVNTFHAPHLCIFHKKISNTLYICSHCKKSHAERKALAGQSRIVGAAVGTGGGEGWAGPQSMGHHAHENQH